MTSLVKKANRTSNENLVLEKNLNLNQPAKKTATRKSSFTKNSKKVNEDDKRSLIFRNISTIMEDLIRENEIALEKKNSKPQKLIEMKNNCDLLKNSKAKNEKTQKELESQQHEEIRNIRQPDYFQSELESEISFLNFLERFRKYINFEASTLVLSLIYIDKLTSDKTSNVTVNRKNVHQLFLISLLLALKFNEDTLFNAEDYARVACLDVRIMNFLEKKFCMKLRFDFYVNEELFKDYHQYLTGKELSFM